MPSSADAGTWQLGDRTVNRLGFGAMRLTGTRPFHAGEPRDRDTSIAVLRRAVELEVNHVDTAAYYFSRAWALALGEHVLVIPGTGSVRHLEENVAAAALRLSDDQMATLGA